MKLKAFLIYVVGIHFVLGVVLIKSDFIPRAKAKLGFPADKIEITEHFHRMHTFHSRMDSNLPNQSVIFIGASNIQGLAVSAVTSPSVNYGIGGDTTAGVLKRLPTYKSINNAKAVVINIGGNDLKFRTDEVILSNIQSIAEHIPHKIPIIFCSIFPIDEDVRTSSRGRTNKRIKKLNSKIKFWTEKYDNIHYLDTGQTLIDANGNLADEFHIGDGLHLNSQGYDVWIQQLKVAINNAQ